MSAGTYWQSNKYPTELSSQVDSIVVVPARTDVQTNTENYLPCLRTSRRVRGKMCHLTFDQGSYGT